MSSNKTLRPGEWDERGDDRDNGGFATASEMVANNTDVCCRPRGLHNYGHQQIETREIKYTSLFIHET